MPTVFWDADIERDTIADLEIYGLSLRMICCLEKYLDVIYVDQLRQVTAERLRECPRIGNIEINKVRAALRNYVAGTPVKTVRECVSMEVAKVPEKKKRREREY